MIFGVESFNNLRLRMGGTGNALVEEMRKGNPKEIESVRKELESILKQLENLTRRHIGLLTAITKYLETLYQKDHQLLMKRHQISRLEGDYKAPVRHITSIISVLGGLLAQVATARVRVSKKTLGNTESVGTAVSNCSSRLADVENIAQLQVPWFDSVIAHARKNPKDPLVRDLIRALNNVEGEMRRIS